MCNIVNSPCIICDKNLPLHLGDYDTNPEEVECFCSEHIPDNDVSVFVLTEDDVYEDRPYIQRTIIFKKGWVMGIRYLTDNARTHKDKNYPNVGADWEVFERS
jgi:hypothetical protein